MSSFIRFDQLRFDIKQMRKTWFCIWNMFSNQQKCYFDLFNLISLKHVENLTPDPSNWWIILISHEYPYQQAANLVNGLSPRQQFWFCRFANLESQSINLVLSVLINISHFLRVSSPNPSEAQKTTLNYFWWWFSSYNRKKENHGIPSSKQSLCRIIKIVYFYS